MTVATSSRASSLPPSKPTREQEETSTMTWTTATFAFPPSISCPNRAPLVPRQRPKSRETRTSSSSSAITSRVINGLPGFDDFAELVMTSERAVPKLTLTAASSHSPRISRSRHAHPHRSKPSEPKPSAPVVPAQSASLPWSNEDNDAGRVTFIFGRFRPSIIRQSAPPSTRTAQNQVRSKDFVNLPSPQEQPAPQP